MANCCAKTTNTKTSAFKILSHRRTFCKAGAFNNCNDVLADWDDLLVNWKDILAEDSQKNLLDKV